MAFRTNYNQQRAERDRAKQAKKDEKLRERQEEAARRKAGLAPLAETADEHAPAPGDDEADPAASPEGPV